MEYNMKCSICLKTFSYTDSDVRNSKISQSIESYAALSAAKDAVKGDKAGVYANANLAAKTAQITRDYSKCPYCGSTKLIRLRENDIEQEKFMKAVKAVKINGDFSKDVSPLLDRAELFLEEDNWVYAYAYADTALNFQPKNAKGYLILLLTELKCHNIEELPTLDEVFDGKLAYKRAIQFGDSYLVEKLSKAATDVWNRVVKPKQEEEQKAKQETSYLWAMHNYKTATTEKNYLSLVEWFRELSEYGYEDCNAMAQKCEEKAKELHMDGIVKEASEWMRKDTIEGYTKAIEILDTVIDWKNAKFLKERCEELIQEKQRKEQEKENRKSGWIFGKK